MHLRLSPGLVERAFSPPGRHAPLTVLAVELRGAGVWVEFCRLAAERQPGWLEDRLGPADPLVAAIGLAGDSRRDEAVARAICEIALAVCGRRDEASALAGAATALGEPPPGDISRLEPDANPQLTDLVADLRAPRDEGFVASAGTVVEVAGRGAALGAAVVEALPGHPAGLRLDSAKRVFSPADPALQGAIRAAATRLGATPACLLARVESEAGEPAGGDACGAAILLAAEAAQRGRSVDERTLVAAALSAEDERLGRPRSPAWEEAGAVLRGVRPGTSVVAAAPVPGARATQVQSLRSLRRVMGRSRRRRRSLVAAVLAVAAAGVAAALIVPSLGSGVEAGRDARRAEDLLASNPGQAAMLAARALADREDEQTLEAALRVTAAAPLTEASGREAGTLLAVAIDDGGTVTTVSSAGRATRWELRDRRLLPRSAVAIPPEADLTAISPGGRWLLLRTSHIYGDTLLVDAEGRHSTRILDGFVEDSLAVSDGERPTIARDDGDMLTLVDGGTPPTPEHEVASLAFSPSGRLLAVGDEAGGSTVFARAGGEWRVSRPWREETSIATVSAIEVDDAGTTVANLDSSVGPGLRWRSPRGSGDAHVVERGGWLAGRNLTFESVEGELRLMHQRPGAPDRVLAIAFPLDDKTARPVAVSPAGDRAVVAAPGGYFHVLDLRRVRPAGKGVVPGSVYADGDRLSTLEVGPGGSRLVAWDLDVLSRPTRGPRVPGSPRVAVRPAAGSLLIHSSDGEAILVRRGPDGAVIGRLRSRGGESWSSVAADRAGDLVAGVDERSGAVTAWRLQRDGGHLYGRVVFRSRPLSTGGSSFPPPLAISPGGDRLVYGTATRLLLRDVASGVQWSLPSGAGEAIRARFDPDGERLLVSTSKGVLELSGDGLRSRRRPVAIPAHDAVHVPTGAVAAATGFGVQLYTPDGDSIEFHDAATGDGLGPGTISAQGGNAILVPHIGRLPLVALQADRPSAARLCALAGGREAEEGGSCGPLPALPEARTPPGAPGDRSADTALSANGLGWLRLGERLPPAVERLPAYIYGSCATRALPGRGAAVVTQDGRIESIALAPVPYAEEGAPFRSDAEVATDLGLTPSGVVSAPEIYGPPDRRFGSRKSWLLPRGEGGPSVLSVDDSEAAIPLSLSVEEVRCDLWG